MAEIALVTGGETGIGKAVSDALRDAGYQVKTASRRTGCDLTSRDAVADLVASLDRLDVLINNAGIAESAPFSKTTDELWNRHFAINATAPFLLCRAALPLLRKSPRGRIVFVASTAALRGSPYVSAYVASKHALLGLARALAAELSDVAVNTVCPGFVQSPLTDRAVQRIVQVTGKPEAEVKKELAAQNRSGRLILPEEVARTVLDLVQGSDTAREIVLE